MENSITLQIGITDFCNYRCKMCIQCGGNMLRNNKGFMTFPTWRSIIDKANSYGKPYSLLMIWIGESFLHPQLIDFIRYAFEADENSLLTSVIIYTNGSRVYPFISEQIIDLSVRYKKRFDIVFSFVSNTPETARLMNPSTRFEEVLGNALYFSDYAIANAPHQVGVNMQYVVTEDNQDEAGDFILRWSEYFRNAGVEYGMIIDYYLERWERHDYKISLMPEGNEKNSVRERNREIYQTVLAREGLLASGTRDNSGTVSKKNKFNVKCSSPWEFYVINWNGDVTVCCRDFKMDLKFGNIKHSSFFELASDFALKKIRRSLIDNRFSPDCLCRNCEGFKGDFSKIYDEEKM